MLYSGFKLIQQRDGCLRLVDMNIAATDNMLELVNEILLQTPMISVSEYFIIS